MNKGSWSCVFDGHKPLNNVADAPSPEELTNFLESVFRSNLPPEKLSPVTGFDIPPFTLDEIRKAVGKLKHRRCPDPCGIVAEMFRFANDEILVCLMDIFNRMIHSGVLESNWQSTLFTMLFKSGEKKDPGNWRPVALLHISYKIFSNLLHGRWSACLCCAGNRLQQFIGVEFQLLVCQSGSQKNI